jgi:hypothetical protein
MLVYNNFDEYEISVGMQKTRLHLATLNYQGESC